MDELFLADSALAILQTGDWNPHFFHYPSLPIYLTTAGLAVGTLREAGAGRAIDVEDLRPTARGRPYRPLQPMRTARQLFVVIGLLGLLFTGFLGRQLTQRAELLWLAPLLLAVPAGLTRSGWEYLNVDVVATTFTAATLAFLIGYWQDDSAFSRAIGPGLLTGLAIASKYTAGVLVVPCLLTLWLAPGRNRGRRVVAYGVVTAATFAAGVPYAVLDFPEFINGLAFEVRHYAVGHPGYDGPAGWLQFRHYLGETLREFGALNLALSAVGFAVVSIRNPRQSAVVASVGVLLLLYMSQQRVHFLRNLYPLYVGLATFCAAGWLFGYDFLVARVRHHVAAARFAAAAVGLLLAIAMWAGAPTEAMRSAHRPHQDSRNRLAAWVRERAPDATLLLPNRLPYRAGAGDAPVVRYAMNGPGLRAALAELDDVVLVVPQPSESLRLPGGRREAEQWQRALAALVRSHGLEPALRLGGAAFDVRGDARPLNPALVAYRIGPPQPGRRR
jgi:hypothetical protein